MAIVEKNIILQGLSGKLGKILVFRQRGGKTIVAATPRKTDKAPSEDTSISKKQADTVPISEGDRQQVFLAVTPAKLLLTMEKQAEDVTFVRSLQYVRWNSNAFRWEITSQPENLQAIRDYFGERLPEQQGEDLAVVS